VRGRMCGMKPNPYESPQDGEAPRRPASGGLELAKDTASLLVVGLLASIVAIPILFILVAVIYGMCQYVGIPLPNP
jgi:hypothetical protein